MLTLIDFLLSDMHNWLASRLLLVFFCMFQKLLFSLLFPARTGQWPGSDIEARCAHSVSKLEDHQQAELNKTQRNGHRGGGAPQVWPDWGLRLLVRLRAEAADHIEGWGYWGNWGLRLPTRLRAEPTGEIELAEATDQIKGLRLLASRDGESRHLTILWCLEVEIWRSRYSVLRLTVVSSIIFL